VGGDWGAFSAGEPEFAASALLYYTKLRGCSEKSREEEETAGDEASECGRDEYRPAGQSEARQGDLHVPGTRMRLLRTSNPYMESGVGYARSAHFSRSIPEFPLAT
jgi:hypothetical protein